MVLVCLLLDVLDIIELRMPQKMGKSRELVTYETNLADVTQDLVES